MQNENFYCYSLKMFHYISAFGEKCYASKINKVSGKRYWVFKANINMFSTNNAWVNFN